MLFRSAHEILARQLLQWCARANDGRIVQQPVQMAEFGLDHRGQLVVLMGLGSFEVERDDHRLRMAGGLDFVVDLAQVGFGLAQQQHGGAVGGEGLGGGGTDAATGATKPLVPASKQP